jgi:hypothetical protein
VYRSELAMRLHGLGYEIERGKYGQPEIRGYTQEYLDASSPRGEQIKEHLQEIGRDGAGAAQVAAHRTRDSKELHSPQEMLQRHRELAAQFAHQADRVVAQAREHTLHHTQPEKTTTLAVVREGAEAQGYTVEGFAPTSRAAHKLAEAGIETSTLQHHLARGEQPETGERRLFVVDESSLASTRQMHEFVTRLHPNDRVLLVGDRVLINVDTELGAKDLLNNRMAYVSVSRGQWDAQIFTNDREKLSQALGHDVSHQSAHTPDLKPPQHEIAETPKQEKSQGTDIGLSL